MISLIDIVINPVKSCITSGHSFLQQEFIVSGSMALTVFFCNNDGIFNGVILLDFCGVLSGFSSIALTILSTEYHV